jgi:hypothetical protein
MFGSTSVTLPDRDEAWDYVWKNSVVDVLRYLPLLVGWYGLCLLFIKTNYSHWPSLQQEKVAGSISMYPAFVVLIVTSHFTAFADPTFVDRDGIASLGSVQARTDASTSLCDVFANLYIATNIVQAMGQIQTERPPLLHQLMAHHVVSVLCYVSGFYFNRFRYWTSMAGCCEITNLFLIPVYLCKEFFPSWRSRYWYLWNTRLLYATFITHRLLLFPCWLLLWYYDRWNSPTVIHIWEGVLYPSTVIGLLLLSTLWFRTISRGLAKQAIEYHRAAALGDGSKKEYFKE